jgi:hypothetical protein
MSEQPEEHGAPSGEEAVDPGEALPEGAAKPPRAAPAVAASIVSDDSIAYINVEPQPSTERD